MRNVLKERCNTRHLCSLMLNPLDLQHFRENYCIVTCNLIVKLFWVFFFVQHSNIFYQPRLWRKTSNTPLTNMCFYFK